MLKKTSFLITLTLIFTTSLAQAKMAPPASPAKNPHPPVTEKDKARVDFAIQQIKELLQKPSQDHKKYQEQHGLITQFKHVHIIPKSMRQAKGTDVKVYQVHAYVQFKKHGSDWYNLKIILREDAQGKVTLVGFSTVRMADTMKREFC